MEKKFKSFFNKDNDGKVSTKTITEVLQRLDKLEKRVKLLESKSKV